MWAFTLKNNEKGFCLDNLEFHCYISVGDDEEAILKKVNEYLQEFYKNDEYIITNIIPYKEVFYRELKKEFTDVLKKFIQRNKVKIIITLILSCIAAYLGGLTRPYSAFGGEDMLIIACILYWVFSFLDYKERKEK